MTDIFSSATLLLFLLNPFLIIVYLIDMVEKMNRYQFARVLSRAGIIAGCVFCLFAILGDVIFSSVLHAEFASFQIFGGVIFLLIGVQFVFRGPTAIKILRGQSAHIAGAIAMPVLIGPGTISASVIIGEKHNPLTAVLIIILTVFLSILLIYLLKTLFDFVRPRHEELVQRYMEITGRITALYVGTVSVEMIMRGILAWADKF